MGTGDNGSPQNDWWEYLPPIVGISEAESGQLSVYPNPAKDKITVEGELKSAGCEIKIIDLSGSVKKELRISHLPATISISDLEAGIYILKVATGEKIAHQRITVLNSLDQY